MFTGEAAYKLKSSGISAQTHQSEKWESKWKNLESNWRNKYDIAAEQFVQDKI